MKKHALLVLSAAFAASIGATASAQPMHNQPGSILVYPRFDSQPATATIINVTNTNTDRTVCEGNDNLRVGDVRVHYVYFGALESDLSSGVPWLEFDRFEDLTPGDTLSVLASDHNPEGEIGFLTVKALSPDLDESIAFNYLIGSAYIANSNLDILWCYTPFSFQGFRDEGESTCGHGITQSDPGSNFDGRAYSQFPDRLFIDSFFEENPGLFENRLTLMSTSGQDFINEVDFLFWNNKEDRFSRTFKFVCWTQVALSDISAVVRSLNGDPDEFIKETGWASINGRRVLDLSGNPVRQGPFEFGPAILGVFEQTVRVDFVSGHALHYTGYQDAALPN